LGILQINIQQTQQISHFHIIMSIYIRPMFRKDCIFCFWF